MISFQINKMSSPFEIAAKAVAQTPPSTLDLPAPALKPGPKPLLERSSLHSLQLARHNTTPLAITAEGLLAQFKADHNDESDSESSAGDIRKRSYSREQKLAAIGYATTKKA
jgi:hypothetical protein